MKIVHMDREELFSVELDESTGKYYLCVIKGGAGVYEEKRELTSDELREFAESPTNLVPAVRKIRAG